MTPRRALGSPPRLPELATDPLQLLEDALATIRQRGVPERGEVARLLDTIREGYPESLSRPAAELMTSAAATPAALGRLLAEAGFRDYAELRYRAADAENALLSRPDQRFARRLTSRSRDSLVKRLTEREARNVEQSLREATEDGGLELAAARLVSARHRYVVGERKSYAFAHLLAADLSAVMSRVTMVDGLVVRDPDVLIDAADQDVAVVVSLRRYSATTLRLARRFAAQGTDIIAITDAPGSPVARLAAVTLVARTASESFADSPTAVAAICHALSALAATRAKGARRRLARREELTDRLWLTEDDETIEEVDVP